MRWLALSIALIAVEATAIAAPCDHGAVASEVTALGGPALDSIGVAIEIDGLTGSVVYVMSNGELVGPRTVKASSCRELAKSLALVIVMSWRADDRAVTPPRTVEPPREAPITVEPLAVATAGERDDAPAPDQRHIAALLGAATDATGRPALVAGARVRRGRMSLGLELSLVAPVSLDAGDGAIVRVSQYGADVAPCFHVSRFALCGLATAGVIGGAGTQLAHAANVWRPALALGARVEASVPVLPRVALRLHVDALQALTSSRFTVDEMPVWTSEPRQLWVGGGIQAVFP